MQHTAHLLDITLRTHTPLPHIDPRQPSRVRGAAAVLPGARPPAAFSISLRASQQRVDLGRRGAPRKANDARRARRGVKQGPKVPRQHYGPIGLGGQRRNGFHATRHPPLRSNVSCDDARLHRPAASVPKRGQCSRGGTAAAEYLGPETFPTLAITPTWNRNGTGDPFPMIPRLP